MSGSKAPPPSLAQNMLYEITVPSVLVMARKVASSPRGRDGTDERVAPLFPFPCFPVLFFS